MSRVLALASGVVWREPRRPYRVGCVRVADVGVAMLIVGTYLCRVAVAAVAAAMDALRRRREIPK